MGRRPVRRRSARLQKVDLRNALRRGQRAVCRIRTVLYRHPVLGGRSRHVLIGRTRARTAYPRRNSRLMAHVDLIYYLDVLSSWCHVADYALERIETVYGDAVRVDWRIAQLFDYGPLPYSQNDLK